MVPLLQTGVGRGNPGSLAGGGRHTAGEEGQEHSQRDTAQGAPAKSQGPKRSHGAVQREAQGQEGAGLGRAAPEGHTAEVRHWKTPKGSRAGPSPQPCLTLKGTSRFQSRRQQ